MGSNGKSMMQRLVRDVFGDYCVSVSANILTAKRVDPGRPNPELLLMRNKRIAFFNESEDETNINSGILKELCGMDAVSYRGLYEPTMTSFVMTALPILLCNTKPNVPDRTNAIWRRLTAIPFLANFTETPNPTNFCDRKLVHNIADRIPAWKDYFATLLITSGYKTFIDNDEDYGIPPSVMASTNEYKVETDYFIRVFPGQLQVTGKKEDCILWNLIYLRFTNWFRAHHPNEKVPSKKVVKPQIEKIIKMPCAIRYNVGHQEVVCWVGWLCVISVVI